MKRRHVVLWTMCAGLSMCYAQRTSLSVAVNKIVDELGWSETQKGLLLSAFFWGYCVGMLPGGFFVRRHGGFVMFALSVGGSALLTAAVAVSQPIG